MNLSTDEQVAIIPIQIALIIGQEKAVILMQLHKHLQQQTVLHNGETWYCQSIANWQKQLPFWNEPKIKRMIRELENLGIVHSTDKFNHFYVDCTKWYKIDYEKLQQVIDAYKKAHHIEDDNFGQLTKLQSKTTNEQKHNNKQQNQVLAKQIDMILTYLNEKTAKNFSLKSQANRNFISGRLKEGYSVDDCRLVIDEQVAYWLNDFEMDKYLRPMTLFRPANFESYLNNANSKKAGQTRTSKAVVLDFDAGEDWS